MPCEVEIYERDLRSKSLCPHGAVTVCSSCGIGLCNAHIIDCEVCDHFICPDCVIEHRYFHDLAEEKMRARA